MGFRGKSFYTITPDYKHMRRHTQMRLLVVWCLVLQVVDCWTTYHLANYYGWEGELNLIVKGFISQSAAHMIFLKLVVVLPLLGLYGWLWDEVDEYDVRHLWAIRLMFTYNCFATGILTHNLIELYYVSKLPDQWLYG